MPNSQMNITVEKSGQRTSMTTQVRKNILEHLVIKGFTIISVQYL